MNDNVIITKCDGTQVTYTQDEILAPKFSCHNYPGDDYVHWIAEMGLTTRVNNGDGSYTYTHLSPYCICEVTFTNDCKC